MKIVFTILGIYNSGGMERVLANKANYLVNHGYSVTIITTDQKGRKPYFNLNEAIELVDLDINYKDNIGRNIFNKVFSYLNKQREHKAALTSELLKQKASIVISMFDNDAGFLYKIKDGSRKVIEVHFSRYKRIQYNRKGLLGWIDKIRNEKDLAVVEKYDRFVVLTHEDKSYWGDLKNIEVIANANSFSSNLSSSLENRQAIAVGRLDFQKGFDDLIKAWKIVCMKNPEWILNIYGDGPLKKELEGLIYSLELQNVVFLQSPTKNIDEAYFRHSILVMTSRYEGLPMALIEGQSFGLPLVSYACKCGPQDIIEDGVNGFLINEGDISALADKVILLINNSILRKEMGQAALSKSSFYNEDVIMKKWINLFNSLNSDQ